MLLTISIHCISNLEIIRRPVDNVVIATKGLQNRNINIIAGTTVENKGTFILLEGLYHKKAHKPS